MVKKKAPELVMIPVTVDGITIEVHEKALRDYDLQQAIIAITKGDPVEDEPTYGLLFRDGLETLKETLRGEDGYLDTDRLARIFWGVIGELQKNSLSS